MDLEPGSHNEQFIEYSIRTGKTHLLVWEEPGEGITGACTIEIIDYPMERIAHVNLMGGKGIVRDYVFDEAKEFMIKGERGLLSIGSNPLQVSLRNEFDHKHFDPEYIAGRYHLC